MLQWVVSYGCFGMLLLAAVNCWIWAWWVLRRRATSLIPRHLQPRMRYMLPYTLIVVFGWAYLRGSDRELGLILSLLRLHVCFLVPHVVVLVVAGSWVWRLIQIVLRHLVSHARIALVASDGSFGSCFLIRYPILYLVQLVLLVLRVSLIDRQTRWCNYSGWIVNFGIDISADVWLSCNYFTMFFVYYGRWIRRWQ